MSPSFVSSARRRRHGGLSSAALFNPLVEAATGALPLIDAATGLPAAEGGTGPGAAPSAPAQGAAAPVHSTEAASAQG